MYQGNAGTPNFVGTTYFPANPIPSSGAGVNNSVNGWYGIANSTATGLPAGTQLFVVYNANAGSMTGLAQILTPLNVTPTAYPVSWTKIPSLGASGSAFTCTAVTPKNSTIAAQVCSTTDANHDVYAPLDLALSDVYATEAVPGVLTPGSNNMNLLGTLTQVTTGLEGFGIIVNPTLYVALQTAQGLVPGDLGGANQPSISRQDYASLISTAGADAGNGSYGPLNGLTADFVQDPNNPTDATQIVIERRTNYSGTQSASDMFFLNYICGTAAGSYLLPFDNGTQFGSSTPTLAIGGTSTYFAEQGGTGGVKNALTLGNAKAIPAGAYGIGVVSLENTPTVTDPTSWQYVKLNGVSPNWKYTPGTGGTTNNANYTYDTQQKASIISGQYQFAVEMNAYYRTTSVNANIKTIDATVAKNLSLSNLHNLTGVAYLDFPTNPSAVLATQARYSHQGSNCAPLWNKNF